MALLQRHQHQALTPMCDDTRQQTGSPGLPPRPGTGFWGLLALGPLLEASGHVSRSQDRQPPGWSPTLEDVLAASPDLPVSGVMGGVAVGHRGVRSWPWEATSYLAAFLCSFS